MLMIIQVIIKIMVKQYAAIIYLYDDFAKMCQISSMIYTLISFFYHF